jgi:hypothetical protein
MITFIFHADGTNSLRYTGKSPKVMSPTLHDAIELAETRGHKTIEIISTFRWYNGIKQHCEQVKISELKQLY